MYELGIPQVMHRGRDVIRVQQVVVSEVRHDRCCALADHRVAMKLTVPLALGQVEEPDARIEGRHAEDRGRHAELEAQDDDAAAIAFTERGQEHRPRRVGGRGDGSPRDVGDVSAEAWPQKRLCAGDRRSVAADDDGSLDRPP